MGVSETSWEHPLQCSHYSYRSSVRQVFLQAALFISNGGHYRYALTGTLPKGQAVLFRLLARANEVKELKFAGSGWPTPQRRQHPRVLRPALRGGDRPFRW